jgi:hypothetical protein
LVLDKLFGGIAGLLVDVEISITDRRDAVYLAEFDCLISAEPQHRVGDLSVALLSLRGGVPGGPGGPGGWQAGPPGLWLDGAQLDPSAPLVSKPRFFDSAEDPTPIWGRIFSTTFECFPMRLRRLGHRDQAVVTITKYGSEPNS